jgi:spermidine synthase
MKLGSDEKPGVIITGVSGYELSLRALYLGVFLISMGVLLLEISLTRIFSYSIWYHFTYVTISLAMLGFGASGAVLASSEKLAGLDMRLAQRAALIGAVSVPVMLVIVSKVPFHPFQLFSDPTQIVFMVIYYIAVTLPFFCAGLAISCAFKSIPQEASRIYSWDLLGAGAGCLSVVTAIHLFGVPGVAATTASLFLLASAIFLRKKSGLRRLVIVVVALVWLPFAANIEKALEFNASKEKWISRLSTGNIEFSKWSPIFRVDAFKAPVRGPALGGPYKSHFGIKNEYLPPDYECIFISHDGDACTRVTKSDEDLSIFDVFEKSILKAPYLLTDSPKVLIIGPGGGTDVGVALRNNASSIVAVELDPITIDLTANVYSDYAGNLYHKPGVEVIADEGRSFMRRSDEKFDVIQITGVDTLAALTSGAYVLAENYLYTTEAFKEYLSHLTPNGVLSVEITDHHYRSAVARHSARHVSLSVAALQEMGIEDPYKHIAVIAAQKDGVTWISIMTKLSPFTFSEIAALREFAEDLSFDIWYLPGDTADNPCAYIATFNDADRARFYQNYPLKVDASTDDSPFFFHYYRWASLIQSSDVDTGHTGATGQLILLLILVFSVLFSIALIIFPLIMFRRAGLQTRWKWHYILYFAALGLGFIFLEISYIQRFILFLGYPTYSLTVILFSILTFSGIGSYFSGRLSIEPRNLILAALLTLAIVALGYMVLLPPIFNHFLGASKQVRIAISLVLLFPLGLLLGTFFPTGIKIISGNDKRFIPWAWGINGCASVIGTVLSIIIAMSYGFRTVTVLAVIIYIIGVVAMYRVAEESPFENL